MQPNQNEIDVLKNEIKGLENEIGIFIERFSLFYNFFDKINDAYNDRVGNLLNYNVEDEKFLNEIVSIIKTK